MKRPFTALAAGAAFAAAAAAAVSLARPLFNENLADWLKVEAPPVAERDWPFTIIVRPENQEPDLFLRVDLHGQDAGREDLGFVTGGPAVAIADGVREYSVDLKVPSRSDLAYVNGIIYISTDGSWDGRVAFARLDPVPVEGPGAAAEKPRPRPVKARRDEPSAETLPGEPSRRDYLPLRIAAAAAWAACAALSSARERRPGSVAFSIACLLSALCELVLVGSGSVDVLRGFARDAGVYLYRRAPQAALTLAALFVGLAAIGLSLAAALRTGRAARGAALFGLCGYWAFICLRLISHHDIDALLSSSVGGIRMDQAARTALAALALAAAAVEAGRGADARRA
jgi:hypothetical protein